MTLNTMQRMHSVSHRTVDHNTTLNIIAGTLSNFWTQEIDDCAITLNLPSMQSLEATGLSVALSGNMKR